MEEPDINNATDHLDKYIRTRYESAINYYWTASRTNRSWYKITRALTIIFGAVVTLVASLSSSSIFPEEGSIHYIFSLGTPVLAAMLAIIAGFSQSFQWGSTWQNMVLTAQHLQKEYDKYLVSPPEERKYEEETIKLNTFVITETEGFFERMLGGVMSEVKPEKENHHQDSANQ